MKNEKVLKAQFHIGEQLGNLVKSSCNVAEGYAIEMWPMGLLITAPAKGNSAQVRKVVTYNNIRGFDLDPAHAEESAPAKVSSLKK